MIAEGEGGPGMLSSGEWAANRRTRAHVEYRMSVEMVAINREMAIVAKPPTCAKSPAVSQALKG